MGVGVGGCECECVAKDPTIVLATHPPISAPYMFYSILTIFYAQIELLQTGDYAGAPSVSTTFLCGGGTADLQLYSSGVNQPP